MATTKTLLYFTAFLVIVLFHFPGEAVMLDNTTTRDVCVSCGCVASFANCHCGSDKKKLACLKDGGPNMTVWDSPPPAGTTRPNDGASTPTARQAPAK